MINRLLNHIHRFLAQDLSEFKADITNLFVRAINSIKLLSVVMEDKRLNINQPLLSVRRLSPKAASQKNENRKFGSYLPTMPPIEPFKTEFKLDPLKNTGSIPFVWEHSPGRPKDDESHNQIQPKEYPLGLPKLPPGRISKPRKKDSDNITQDHVHLHLHTNLPKDRSSLQSVFQTEEKKSRFERSKSMKKEIRSDSSEGDDNNNETFMDALDTLSRGDQSSFYNCSTSGVNVNVNSTHDQSDVMNTSGILRSDPKLRDFMMGRFIPAAKAMASETQTPHHHLYSSRKQIFRDNHPREVKKLANMENKKLQLRYGPMFLQDTKEEEEEEDDSYHEYYEHEYEHENSSFKFCGLLPRFCSRGSLNLVGPVPGIGMKPMRISRTHASSNSLGSFIEIEKRSLTRSHLVKHHDSIGTSNQKNHNHNHNYNFNHNHPKLEGSKLYNRLQGCGFSESSVSENESSSSSSQKKRLSFKELLNDKNNLKNERVRDNQDSIIEKTLYVDTENSIPSNVKQENTDTDTQGHVETQTQTQVVDQSPKDSEDSAYDTPTPPPLPKSPSDSWLGRTLPSVSSNNKQTTIRWNPRFRPSDMLAAESESDKTPPLRIPKGPLLPIPES